MTTQSWKNELHQTMLREIARVRLQVMPFWAGTETFAKIQRAVDASVQATARGDETPMQACLDALRAFGTPIAAAGAPVRK